MHIHGRIASTQYNDLIGDFAADGHDGVPLFDLARECGIDTDAYFPVGVSAHFGVEPTQGPVAWLTFRAIDRKAQAFGAEEIIALARKQGGKLATVRLEPTQPVPLATLFEGHIFKRLELVVYSRGLLAEGINFCDGENSSIFAQL